MSNRVNHRKGLDLAAVAPSQRANRLVTWGEGMRPAAFPHARGTVFLSKGKETFVIWDGTTRPALVFTGALVLA